MGGGQRRSAGLFGKEQLVEAEGASGLLPGPAPDAVRRSQAGLGGEGEGGGRRLVMRGALAPPSLLSLGFIVRSSFGTSPNFPLSVMR